MKSKLALLGLALLLFWPAFGQTQHGATLTWTPGVADATHVAATYFNIYRSTTAGGPYSKINASNVTATTYFDSTGNPGTKYYYVITGNAPGSLESGYSNEVSATFLSQTAAPGSLAVTVN